MPLLSLITSSTDHCHHRCVIATPPPLKRKRSGEDVTTIEIEQTPPVEHATILSDMNLLLLQKDEVINQLQLELARANNELVKMQWRLSETEKMLFEAWKQIPRPPNALDVYKTGVESVEKAHNTLLEQVYSRSDESQGITTDTFAQASVRHLDTVKAFARMEGGLVPAFDLVMLLARTCWYDPDARKSMSGDGDSEEPFLRTRHAASQLDRRETHVHRKSGSCKFYGLAGHCIGVSQAHQRLLG